MSGLVGTVEDVGSHAVNLFGDVRIGNTNVNEMVLNMTLFSILLTTLRGNVKGRSKFDDEYDFIVIGGGTAGAIMASRLSQHPCIKVLLLEAGGEQPLLTMVPGFARGFLGTSIDWGYYTVPQKYSSFGQKDKKVLWNSGKVLGGSSSINAMLGVRGNKENYDQWAREGCTGWNYDAVFPYFMKLEDNKNIDEVDQGYHREGGPMGFEKSIYKSKIRKYAMKALQDMGFPLRDINGRKQFGVFDLQGTIRNQERCSTSRAYLKPAHRRKNLHIVTNAFVRKILINRTNGNRAFAVVFEHKKKVHVVRIRKSDFIRDGVGEIILSNGATRTPQTLMLSGIGPKEELEKFKIPVIANLPVGKNLMDHYAAGLLYELDPLLMNAFVKQITPDNLLKYFIGRVGPLTIISQVTLLAFLNGLNNTSPSYDFPMQQLYFLDYNTEDAVKTLNLESEVEENVFNPYVLKPAMLCYAQLLQPYSRGEITLNSVDPHDHPNINPNYYADQRDVDNVVEAMRLCNAVASHPAMQKIKTKWVDRQRSDYPGCEHLQDDEYKYFECIARSVTITIWHPTGTARMGHPKDPRSVVDPQLRVIGVSKLRVVNAAIMPIIPSANTNVPTMMIAEKAYDMMKDSIKCPSTVTISRKRQVPDYN